MQEFFITLRLIQKQWPLVLFVFLAMTGGTALFTVLEKPVYQTETTLIVAPNKALVSTDEIIDVMRAIQSRAIIATYKRIAVSKKIQQKAFESLGTESAGQKNVMVRAGVIPETNILRVIARGPDPKLAKAMADAVAEQTKVYVDEIYRVLRLEILDRANEPTVPVSPRVWRAVGSAALLGLFLGLVVAFVVGGLRHPELRGAMTSVGQGVRSSAAVPGSDKTD